LDKLFLEYGVEFKSITLAYQSKVGPMPWLEPSLKDELKICKNEKVILVPLSFVLDNSESVLELGIEYKRIAREMKITDCRLAPCVNDSDLFCEFVQKEVAKLL